MRSPEEDSHGPVIRDRRRIDPVTGQVRNRQAEPTPGGGPAAAAGQEDAAAGSQGGRDGAAAPPAGRPTEAAQVADQLAERTADLQRLQAEYANYRKRVERDRMAVREQALANVLTELLPVLDDIGRAREHGELSGGFRSVAESLEAAASKLGLSTYGEPGEPFDPKLHEALMHSYSPDVTEPTCVRILQPGYKVAERILRPARVAVAEPGEPEGLAEPGEPGAGNRADGPGSEDNGKDQRNEGGGEDAHSYQQPAGSNGGAPSGGDAD